MTVRITRVLTGSEYAELNRKGMADGYWHGDVHVFPPGTVWYQPWYYNPLGEEVSHVMIKDRPADPNARGFLSPHYWRDWADKRPPMCVVCPNGEQWEIDRSALEIYEHGCLGRGSFGEVHRGSWRGTEVAVKRLREDMANDRELLEFRRELAIVNHLAHPNIVQFLGACTNSMPLCIVTEFMPGGNLADLLSARGEDRPFPVGKVLNWALDCAKGMRYLHERRPTMIIHRDLKPENLLIDAAGKVKITDFGLSKSAMQLRGERSATSEEQTVSRTTCGTWLYTAPEVYKKEPYSAKVDQFAFAMILFELLQGTPPFRSLPAEEATVQLALGHRPQFKRDLMPELRDLVERCWHHDPGARPSFADIQRALEAALAKLQPADFEERRNSVLQRTSSPRHSGAEAAAQPGCACVLQ